jgi:hypothetical protein
MATLLLTCFSARQLYGVILVQRKHLETSAILCRTCMPFAKLVSALKWTVYRIPVAGIHNEDKSCPAISISFAHVLIGLFCFNYTPPLSAPAIGD